VRELLAKDYAEVHPDVWIPFGLDASVGDSIGAPHVLVKSSSLPRLSVIEGGPAVVMPVE
jgi:hypothetical protein